MSAATLYLHLQALGLRLSAEQRPEQPSGYMIRVCVLERFDPAEREHVRGLIRANKPALLTLLRSGSPDAPDGADAAAGGGHACVDKEAQQARKYAYGEGDLQIVREGDG